MLLGVGGNMQHDYNNEYNYQLLRNFGNDVYISKNVVIKHPYSTVIGNHVAIDDYLYCTTKLKIGDYCHVSSHVSIIGGKDASFTMGNFCNLAAGVRIIVYGDKNLGAGLVSPLIPTEFRDELYGGNIQLGDFVSILTNAVILPNVNIPEGAVIGANSLVTEKCKIQPWEIWVGTPARLLGIRPREAMIAGARGLGYEY